MNQLRARRLRANFVKSQVVAWIAHLEANVVSTNFLRQSRHFEQSWYSHRWAWGHQRHLIQVKGPDYQRLSPALVHFDILHLLLSRRRSPATCVGIASRNGSGFGNTVTFLDEV